MMRYMYMYIMYMYMSDSLSTQHSVPLSCTADLFLLGADCETYNSQHMSSYVPTCSPLRVQQSVQDGHEPHVSVDCCWGPPTGSWECCSHANFGRSTYAHPPYITTGLCTFVHTKRSTHVHTCIWSFLP